MNIKPENPPAKRTPMKAKAKALPKARVMYSNPCVGLTSRRYIHDSRESPLAFPVVVIPCRTLEDARRQAKVENMKPADRARLEATK